MWMMARNRWWPNCQRYLETRTKPEASLISVRLSWSCRTCSMNEIKLKFKWGKLTKYLLTRSRARNNLSIHSSLRFKITSRPSTFSRSMPQSVASCKDLSLSCTASRSIMSDLLAKSLKLCWGVTKGKHRKSQIVAVISLRWKIC